MQSIHLYTYMYTFCFIPCNEKSRPLARAFSKSLSDTAWNLHRFPASSKPHGSCHIQL